MHFVLGDGHCCTVPEGIEGCHHDRHMDAKADLLLIGGKPSLCFVLCQPFLYRHALLVV